MDAALPVHIAYDMTDGRLRSEGARAWVTHAVRSEPGLSFGVDGTNLFKPTGAHRSHAPLRFTIPHRRGR